MEKLIRALRCAATTDIDFICPQDCPYRLGVDRWQSCDITRMVLDAADALEKLQKFQWIPVKVRPTTEEDGFDMKQYPSFLDFPMPDEGQEILVSFGDVVDKDTNMTDDGVSYYLDGWGDWEYVDAWMPLPEPYKGVEK